MWQAIRENPKAVFYAVLMHLVLLVLLLVGLDWTPKAIKPGVKAPVEAELVTNDELKRLQQRKLEDARKAAAEAEKQRQAEAAAQQQAAAEKQRKAEAAKQKAAAEQKRKAELAAQQKAEAAKRKAAAEQQRKADEAARKKAAAEKQRKAEEDKRRREAEAALQAQLAEEAARARAESALAEYIPYIQDKIQRNWLRPPGSPAGLSCVVKVRLLPGGDVGSVSMARSSGDAVFDRSVETAVLKASPLPLPEDPDMFRHFREINFIFDPGR